MKKLIACIAAAAACLALLAVYRSNLPLESGKAPLSPEVTIENEDRMQSYRDYADIILSDAGSTTESTFVSVEENGIVINHSGRYRLTGSLSSGMVIVNAQDNGTVVLILDGVSVHKDNCAALYVLSNNKTILNLAEGSENSLSSSGEYQTIDTNHIDGTVFAKSDLVINGAGRLTVSSGAGHGIVCKDALVFTGGKLDITAEKKGISANDGVAFTDADIRIKSGTSGIHTGNSDDTAFGDILIYSGTFDIDSDGDCIHSNNYFRLTDGTLALSTGDDGIHADRTLYIEGGTVEISESYEGLEGNKVEISGGDLAITAYDDGINASGGSDGFFTNFNSDLFKDDEETDEDNGIVISGGITRINANGDGVDSNTVLTVTGGELYIDGPVNSANGPLDYEHSSSVSGGRVLAIGSAGMAMNFGKESTQGSILYILPSNRPAGTVITLADAAGNELMRHTSAKAFQAVTVSCPEITEGKTYTLTVGSVSYEIEMKGLLYGEGSGFGPGMGGPGNGTPGGPGAEPPGGPGRP